MINTKTIYIRIAAACLIAIVALTVPILIVEKSGILEGQPLYKYLVRSLLVGLVAIGGIVLLRKKAVNKLPKSIGLATAKKAVPQFLFGVGLIAVPLSITIALSSIFGWDDISFNVNNGILLVAVIGLISTFFTDAITEELLFRGYIFSNLKERYNTWKSTLITLGFFVVTPVIVGIVQFYLGIVTGVPITPGFLITLLVFGAFVQYLRILTKSIWAGVGFHMLFVHMNQLMGLSDDKLIQFSETQNQLPVQITLLTLLLMVVVGLILYANNQKKKQSVNQPSVTSN